MKLDNCPVCSYSLRGSQEIMRCPECGLHVGKDPQVFRVRASPSLYLALISAVGAIWVLMLVWTKEREPLQYLRSVNLGGLALGCLYGWHRARSKFMIVSTNEVRIFQNNTEAGVVPLDMDTHANWDWVTGWIRFERFGTKIASFEPQSGKLARAILANIEARIGRERSSQ